jgi:hypothetical protein
MSDVVTKTLQVHSTESENGALEVPKYSAGSAYAAGVRPVEYESLQARPEHQCLQISTKRVATSRS